jgi:ring-1,2-phenylacetyl-CoA epoxidase subunit PaaE
MSEAQLQERSQAENTPRRPAPQGAGAVRTLDFWTVLLLFGMWATLIGNFALHRAAPLPTALHVLIAACAIHLAFTIWHEAVHRNVSRYPWVNNVVGVAGMFPYMTPFFIQKWIHLQHHARLNEPEDPNAIYAGGSLLTLPFRYLRALRYAREALRNDPRPRSERIADTGSLVVLAGVWGAACWYGALSDLFWLWLVPVALAKGVLDWYINWLPHVGLPPDRFRGTRIVDVPWFTPLVLSHNYHAIHHLWPRIPWHRYGAVFKSQLPYLRQHGVPIEYSVFRAGSRPTGLQTPDRLTG